MYYERNINNKLLKSLKNNPVVLLNGARQVGKSTLIEHLIERDYEAHYLSLDDHAVLFAAFHDPYGFLNQYTKPLAIDEVQRNPDILTAIKRIVDTKKQKGQFLLTGSANILTVPKVAESLAGRMILHTLWPLSQGEIRGKKEGFIDWVFNSDHLPLLHSAIEQKDLIDCIVKGGYPRVLEARDHENRQEWIKAYIDTILQRDIRSLANIEGLTDMPRLLAVLAERAGNLLNLADVSRMLHLNTVTLKRYYTLLRMVFLVTELPAWSPNRDKRLAKSPKIYLNDTGLVCYFKQLEQEDFLNNRAYIGPILENFVVMELKKQITWSQTMPHMHHLRTQTGQEVDVVLEGPHKQIIGIEIKASSQINNKDLKGLKTLQQISGNRFTKGIVLYTGTQALPLGNSFYALPINTLWDLDDSS